MENPLRIFTREELEILNPFHLNRLKKEFFIPIRFGGKTSVVLNNHEVDKETLDAIFVELESNFDKYIFDTGSNVLDDFFGRGDIQFLYDEEKSTEVKDLIANLASLETKIAIELSAIINDLYLNLNEQNLSVLLVILDFTSDFEQVNLEIAYQKCHDYIEALFAKIDLLDTGVFVSGNGVEYKDEIGVLVNPMFSRAFGYLPDSFRSFDQRYSNWCYYVIFLNSIVRQTDLGRFKKRDLKIFIESGEIASKYNESQELLSNINSAKSALRNNNKSSSGCWSVISIVIGLFSLIKIIVFFANMSSSSSSPSRYSHKQRTQSQQENYENILRKYQRNEEKRKRTNTKTIEVEQMNPAPVFVFEDDKKVNKKSTKKKENNEVNYKSKHSKVKLCMHYAGENWQLLNAKLKSASYNKDTMVVAYDADLFPSNSHDLRYFIPEDVSHSGTSVPMVAKVSFRNRALNIKTTHLVNIDFDTQKGAKFNSYQKKLTGNNTKLNLSAKRIPFGDYNVKGQIVKRDTKTGKQKSNVRFSIVYNRRDKLFEVRYGKNKRIDITKSEVDNPIMNCKKGLDYKLYATIINNMGHLHNKYISENNWYAITRFCEYRVQSRMGKDDYSRGFILGNGNLRYNFTSKSDNLAYCEFRTKRTAIKYALDHKTGIVSNMIRSTVSDDMNVVEQVIVSRQ